MLSQTFQQKNSSPGNDVNTAPTPFNPPPPTYYGNFSSTQSAYPPAPSVPVSVPGNYDRACY